jgi:hypothetical protein
VNQFGFDFVFITFGLTESNLLNLFGDIMTFLVKSNSSVSLRIRCVAGLLWPDALDIFLSTRRASRVPVSTVAH